MDKPEKDNSKDKPPQNRPIPRPPVPGKNPGFPKGPVPPRGKMGVPRVPPPGAPPGRPPVPPPPAAAGRPPMPPPGAAKPPFSRPPVPPAARPIEQGLSDAEASSEKLENKIADLERKLAEEREKSLMASLRSKEEEAVAAKVETSLRDIQDKLRREKKEKELDEARRKAEENALEMERRLTEEREAWVHTLKNQMNQRDSVTQEMETHFSSRLKDLEHRWAQEKVTLENEIRDREAELARQNQENLLKAEREKAFFEDRIRAISVDRDKLDRELERIKQKAQLELEQHQMEKQNLRETLSRAESALKLAEDQYRIEKNQLQHDLEARLHLAEQKAGIENESLQRELTRMKSELESVDRRLIEKNTQNEGFRAQIAALQAQLDKSQSFYLEIDKNADTIKQQLINARNEIEALQGENAKIRVSEGGLEQELAKLMKQLSDKDRALHDLKENLFAAQINAGQERDRLNEQINRLQSDWKTSSSRAAELQADMESLRATEKKLAARVSQAEAEAEKLRQDVRLKQDELNGIREKSRADLRDATSALEDRIKKLQSRVDWYDANASREYAAEREKVRGEVMDVENKLRQTEMDLNNAGEKIGRLEKANADLQEQIREKSDQAMEAKAEADRRQIEMETLKEQDSNLRDDLALEKDKVAKLKERLEELKDVMSGQNIKAREDLEQDIASKERTIKSLETQLRDFEAKAERAEMKERALRDELDRRGETANEFKERIRDLERDLKRANETIDETKRETDREAQKIKFEKQKELGDHLLKQKENLDLQLKKRLDEMQAEFETRLRAEKQAAAAEAEERVRAEIPPAPDVQSIENEVRQRVEQEMLDQVRHHETQFEQRLKQEKEGAKKDVDKFRWENESLKDEVRKLREERNRIQREAQDLIRQAEDHYRREFEKKAAAPSAPGKNKDRGLFTAIGEFLDKPLIDTRKKSDEDERDRDAA